MTEIALLATALLFGGMTLFSFGFAAFVFNALPAATAGKLVRRAFPWFYLFVFGTSAVAAGCAAAGDGVSAAVLGAIALTTVFAREVLMPAINRATDAGEARRFKVLHALSVLITVAHILGAGAVLLRLATG
ncbi:DUF4149 domain-containing protein [Roseibacterium sp. SDUM158017]|uniref:DUF4149 domain-containing protein n=1 Tax=Roseicyclus salinarum TaxID=3036773 RepID=UPI002415053B|nr:DUF4149 domain-containing protein [Roseibacterium sp. SDUM158017]MDG4649660.1 DUF4149 domain-containing protein [Roseibacterium sp. SDUM158017]